MRPQIHCEFDRFVISHFILPCLVFALVFSALEFTMLDFRIGQLFYDPAIQDWPFREHWFTETVLHDGGQTINISMGILVLLAILLARLKTNLRPYCKQLIFLFIAGITGPILIALLKNTTHIYCPWDLALFGGNKPYIRLFDYANYPLAIGHCFPASHAGGGYALISLYFFFLRVKPEYKYYGLASGLVLGAIFGISQQMRGAHFLSHDIFSLATCWFSSLILFGVFFWKEVQWQ